MTTTVRLLLLSVILAPACRTGASEAPPATAADQAEIARAGKLSRLATKRYREILANVER